MTGKLPRGVIYLSSQNKYRGRYKVKNQTHFTPPVDTAEEASRLRSAAKAAAGSKETGPGEPFTEDEQRYIRSHYAARESIKFIARDLSLSPQRVHNYVHYHKLNNRRNSANTIKLTILVDKDLLRRIDSRALTLRTSRSEYIRRILRRDSS